MGDIDSTAVSGVEVRGYRRGTLSTDPWDQFVVPVKDRIVSYRGRCCSFVTPGRSAVSQKIMALHNATGSSVIVSVNRIRVDLLTTVVKGITILPPIIRVHRFTAVPTNGTALTKVALDTGLSGGATGSASVTLWGDASADNAGAGTSSATTLTVTVPANSAIAQLYAPRFITAVGYEPIDTGLFFDGGDSEIVIRALEGVVVFLDMATTSTGIPTTDKFLATIDWEEYTRP